MRMKVYYRLWSVKTVQWYTNVIVVIYKNRNYPACPFPPSLCDCIAFTYSTNTHRQVSQDFVREALKPVPFLSLILIHSVGFSPSPERYIGFLCFFSGNSEVLLFSRTPLQIYLLLPSVQSTFFVIAFLEEPLNYCVLAHQWVDQTVGTMRTLYFLCTSNL